uniref:Uncharacterized protein n=1 Tax=Paramormyrops kingsleyae TaxID=1676925 RepID=A0A3B3SJ39_9TELE
IIAPLVEDIMQLCCHLATNQKIKAAYTYSAIGALTAAIGALMGGLFFGPFGIATVSVYGSWPTRGQHMLMF